MCSGNISSPFVIGEQDGAQRTKWSHPMQSKRPPAVPFGNLVNRGPHRGLDCVAEHKSSWELLCNLDHTGSSCNGVKPDPLHAVERRKNQGTLSDFECHIKSAESERAARCMFEVEDLILRDRGTEHSVMFRGETECNIATETTACARNSRGSLVVMRYVQHCSLCTSQSS
jgi:hypothetical protein